MTKNWQTFTTGKKFDQKLQFTYPAFENIKFRNFFYIFVGQFALSDLDPLAWLNPDPTPDPDPQHC